MKPGGWLYHPRPTDCRRWTKENTGIMETTDT
ncbi:MAG: hypothetical protein EA365_05645 [Gloeocapsa sp. DLM2.Bin57]|nr:MAG: hypothetical protein EA365_05645 [Gloeocapsa sp. DLM2.Bin57]